MPTWAAKNAMANIKYIMSIAIVLLLTGCARFLLKEPWTNKVCRSTMPRIEAEMNEYYWEWYTHCAHTVPRERNSRVYKVKRTGTDTFEVREQ